MGIRPGQVKGTKMWQVLCAGSLCHSMQRRGGAEIAFVQGLIKDGWEKIGGKWWCRSCIEKGKARRQPNE
jgi:hypothetical protein